MPQYVLPPAKTLSKFNAKKFSSTKLFLTTLFDKSQKNKKWSKETFFGEAGAPSKSYEIKVSEDNYKIIKATYLSMPEQIKGMTENVEYKEKTDKKKFSIFFGDIINNKMKDNIVVHFMLSSKRPAKEGGKKSLDDTTLTRMQERGTAWILDRVLHGHRGLYKNIAEIKKDANKKSDALGTGNLKISLNQIWTLAGTNYLNDKWLDSFLKIQQKMMSLKQYGGTRGWTVFNREGGFMDYISDLISRKFGISKKDVWNPADIWLIKEPKKVEKLINDAVDGPHPTLAELNNVLRQLFTTKTGPSVVGLSLKQISLADAHYEEVNVTKKFFEDLKKGAKGNYFYELQEDPICAVNLKSHKKSKRKTFATQETILIIGNTGGNYNIPVKLVDTTTISNLKWEPVDVKFRKARLGKAPVEMVKNLCKHAGFVFTNNHNEYPKNYRDFIANESKYKKFFKGIENQVVLERMTDPSAIALKGSNKWDLFKQNIKIVFRDDIQTAVSKLMQIHWLYLLLNLSKPKRNQLLTDILFVAQKKGGKVFKFGPFGKLY